MRLALAPPLLLALALSGCAGRPGPPAADPAATSEAGETPAGRWTGVWAREADTLAVTLRFEAWDDGWAGSFDSERLRVEGIPLNAVEFDPPRLSLSLVGDATTLVFDGRISRDSLIGTLRENGAAGTFAFVRDARLDPGLLEEEVRFRNGDVELGGTLIRPPGRGTHPAVAFLHGSGDEGRWASRFLARRFAQAGIAALVWDKRGVGASTGSWRDVGFEELACDAAAAVARLRALPGIDPARVGIHGHSQGGTIAALAAVRSGADFVIGSAASGVPMAEAEVYSVGNFIGLPALPPAEAAVARAYVEALVAVAYGGAPRAELEAAAARARGHDWFFEPPAADDAYWRLSRRIADFDPLAWWSRVEVPVLLVYGAGDERVPVEASRAAIVDAIESAGKTSVEARVFEGGDHTFRTRLPGDVWPRTVGGYPEALIDWIGRAVATADPDA